MAVNPLAAPCGHFSYSDDTPGIDRLGLGIPASRYQQLGYAVLPLARGGKRPHRMLGETGGVHHASLAGADVTRWWSGDPAANIGIATGSRSRLAVLDLDVKEGRNGIQELRRFLASLPQGVYDIPQGCWVRTPSGGVHTWLRTPPGLAVPERPGILPGVDIKGDGGLVVAPPSMKIVTGLARPGEKTGQVPLPYQWNGCPCQAPDAPSWLLDWAATARATGSSSPGGEGEEVPDLRKVLSTGVAAGHRNNSLYKLACSIYRRTTWPKGTDVNAKARELIERAWRAGDTTDFPWSEVETILNSARQWAARQDQADVRIGQQIGQQTMGWLER